MLLKYMYFLVIWIYTAGRLCFNLFLLLRPWGYCSTVRPIILQWRQATKYKLLNKSKPVFSWQEVCSDAFKQGAGVSCPWEDPRVQPLRTVSHILWAVWWDHVPRLDNRLKVTLLIGLLSRKIVYMLRPKTCEGSAFFISQQWN